jgi:hypothetical protein
MADEVWEYYFGSRATLTVGGVAIAALKGIDIAVRFDYVEAYDNSSILRGDVSKEKARVEIGIKSGKTITSPSTDAFMKIIAPSGGLTIEDTNEVWTPDIVGTFRPKGGGTGRTGTIDEVYFDSYPWVLTESQYMVHDWKGIGRNITWATAAA